MAASDRRNYTHPRSLTWKSVMRKPDSEHRARTLKKVPTMNWLTSLANGLKSLLQKKRVERELDEELDSYLEASAAYKQSVGIAPEAARRAALIEVGSRNAVKHQVWSSRWESGLDALLYDLRFSL